MLAVPENTISKVAKILGINRNTLDYRRQVDASFKAIFDEARSRRKLGGAGMRLCPLCAGYLTPLFGTNTRLVALACAKTPRGECTYLKWE